MIDRAKRGTGSQLTVVSLSQQEVELNMFSKRQSGLLRAASSFGARPCRIITTSNLMTAATLQSKRMVPYASSIIFRYYSPAKHGSHGDRELLPLPTGKQRSPLVRFLNPWIDMANVTDDAVLAFKVENVTRTFGVVAALVCSLSAAALAVTPSATEIDDDELLVLTNKNGTIYDATHDDNTTTQEKGNEELEATLLESILQRVVNTDHVAGTSLLVNYWGVPPQKLADIYSACCAAAFYSSVCAMGLSAVLNAWLGCCPPGGTKYFVRYHSLAICSIPGLLAASTGLAGVALFIGLDRSKGTPISYIGLGGTVMGGLLIGSATARGMMCTYRLLTPLVKKKTL